MELVPLSDMFYVKENSFFLGALYIYIQDFLVFSSETIVASASKPAT